MDDNRINKLKKQFNNSDDMIYHDIIAGGINIELVYLDSMVDKDILAQVVVQPLTNLQVDKQIEQHVKEKTLGRFLKQTLFFACNSNLETSLDTASKMLLSGSALLIFEDQPEIIVFSVAGYQKRAITEPSTSAVIKGPREGFVEDISINISLLRRRLKTSSFVVKKRVIGKQSRTSVAVCYLSNVADKEVVKEIEKKLNAINIDGLVDSYYIQEFLQSRKNSIFKQLGSTEKPDVAMAKILEGRVAIIMDGSPLVITIPFVFIEDVQSGDDYYNHPFRATTIRFIRMFGVLLGVLLPGVYVATQTFHYRLIPINLLISLTSSIQNLSFPPLIEILFVLFIFEILGEASVRMPKHLGMALSIIGALVLGDTAVQAGLISPPAVMIVAISGITIYTVPEQVGTMSVLRIIFTFIGGVAGLYGIVISSVYVLAYLASMECFGTAYLAPYAPSIRSDKKDALTKHGIRSMKKRPLSFPNKNRTRMNNEKAVK